MTRYRCALLAASALAGLSAPNALAQSSATYTYDVFGRVVGTTYPSGGSTTYTYDAADNRTRVVSSTSSNHPPTATNDAATVAAGQTVLIDVTNNDQDVDGDPKTITLIGPPSPTKGTASISNNKISYTAGAGQSGTDTFSYTISDGHGGTASATVTVTISANRNPTLTNDWGSTSYQTPVLIPVLSNDTDPDGDALTVASVTNGANGTVQNNQSSVTYSPNAGFASATDTFTYTVSDGRGGTATATVTVTVGAAPANHNPTPQPDSATTAYQTPVTINALGNDTDPDGDPIYPLAITQGTGGIASFSGSSIVYTPNAGFSGNDVFYYSVHDGRGGQGYTAVTVTVAPPISAQPDTVNLTAQWYWDGEFAWAYWSVCLNVLDNDSGQGKTLTGISPSDGVQAWDANGNVCIYTYDSNQAVYGYSMSAAGGGASSTLTVNKSY